MLVKLESEINETSAKCWEDSAPLRSQLENELCTKPLPLAAGHYEGLTQHRPKKRRKSENPNGREVRPSLSLAVRLQKVIGTLKRDFLVVELCPQLGAVDEDPDHQLKLPQASLARHVAGPARA